MAGAFTLCCGSTMSQPLVVLNSVSVRYGIRRLLIDVSLSIGPGERWCILGGNGAGKTVLSETIAGRWHPSSGSIRFPSIEEVEQDVQLVSFEAQRRIMERERRHDESWLLHGRTDPGTTVAEYLEVGSREKARASELTRRFGLTGLLDRGLRYLSTGEMRKTVLCGALLRKPKILILDDPYDGLDAVARAELLEIMDHLADGSRTLVLVLGRKDEMPKAIDTLVYVRDGRITYLGPPHESFWTGAGTVGAQAPLPRAVGETLRDPLIKMEGVAVSYGTTPIIRDITWQARSGEVWHIIGPNGSGKTTLLSLLDGSNPKAYGQRMWLFGRRRGSGESVWEIKRRIGHVSPDFHRSYPPRTTALETVLSGFADSAGLYEEPSGLHLEIAREWLYILGMEKEEQTQLRRLSYGQQRALLVARAMVKAPPILIADEPTQGLDEEHSALVLSVLERIGRETSTCVLYVSHDPTQTLSATTHRMILAPNVRGSTARIEAV